MPEARHYFSSKGRAAEGVVHELATRSFFQDWCYLNPVLSAGRELCDLLVVFDRVAIIFQVKDLKLRDDGRYDQAEAEKNIRQLGGARRRLMDQKRPITLANPRRGRDSFDPGEIAEVYLASVLLGEGENHFQPFGMAKGNVVHVLTGSFLDIALHELDTIGDFVAYLRAKEALRANVSQMVVIGGEEELLAAYLGHNRSFDQMMRLDLAVFEDGSWLKLQMSRPYLAKKRIDEISYGWDDMINRVHEGGTPQYEKIARYMARLVRFERRCMAQAFFDAHVIAHEDEDNEVFRRALAIAGVTYCFLFMEDTNPRERRVAALGEFCYVARGTFRENPVVVGIATDKYFRPECAYDFCLLDVPEWNDQETARMRQIQVSSGVLTNAISHEWEASEYPAG